MTWLNAPSGKKEDRLPVRAAEHNAVLPTDRHAVASDDDLPRTDSRRLLQNLLTFEPSSMISRPASRRETVLARD